MSLEADRNVAALTETEKKYILNDVSYKQKVSFLCVNLHVRKLQLGGRVSERLELIPGRR